MREIIFILFLGVVIAISYIYTSNTGKIAVRNNTKFIEVVNYKNQSIFGQKINRNNTKTVIAVP